MTTLPLNCNNCGAPLPVPESTRYLTCQFCHTQLEVVRDGNAAFTKVLDALQERTEQISADVRRLELKNELLTLEHNWDRESERLKLRNKHGGTYEPSAALAVFVIAVGIVMGVGMGTYFSPLFGFLALVVGVASGIHQLMAASAFDAASKRYQQRKQQLQREINELT
ncbi:MAG: hypothetical protein KDA69_09240 [Planctomycetaceae bacterium]|nr:hypothetical protein [Planctomycetaceae bacterium]MCA9044493.1 hypothetical protein [Planctomycetaceae bacterium]MCB9950505.1 hypothetical protein [Planctomycetaceae bacterium]